MDDDDKAPTDPALEGAAPDEGTEKPSKRAGNRAKKVAANRTHRTQRRGSRSPKAEDRVLASLKLGKSIAAAARAAGVGRRTVYDWRDSDPVFAGHWDDAWEVGTDRLEDLALRGAEKGNDRLLIALLRARRPERFARSLLEHTGGLEVTLKNASESLDAKLARLGLP